MSFTYEYNGHHNKTFSSSAVMKPDDLLKHNSFLGTVMRYSASAFETGVLSLRDNPALSVFGVGVMVLRTST